MLESTRDAGAAPFLGTGRVRSVSHCVGECGHPRPLVDYHVGPCYGEAEVLVSGAGSGRPTAAALEQPERVLGEFRVPAGGVHLLAADEVVGQGYGTSSQVSLCGELVDASVLSSWLAA